MSDQPLALPPGLRVAVIGGLTRATHEWERAGRELGIELEHHDGRTSGSRAQTIAAMAKRAEVVITITVPNSHNGVAIARRAAALHGRVFVLVKRLRPSSLPQVIAEALAAARAQGPGAVMITHDELCA